MGTWALTAVPCSHQSRPSYPSHPWRRSAVLGCQRFSIQGDDPPLHETKLFARKGVLRERLSLQKPEPHGYATRAKSLNPD
jgi:hypothetical protein